MPSDIENHKKLTLFFNNEYHSLKAYTQSRINNAADQNAEDIVQDVALKLFSRPYSASPINNIAGFVYRALRNRIIDLLRTKKDMYPISSEIETMLIESMHIDIEIENPYSKESIQNLKAAINNLKLPYREIIIAFDFEGYTYRDISQKTGIPQGTLMSRRHRALSLLFKELERKNN